MPRTRLFRLTAALLAALTSFSTPVLAYAHGWAHAHLASTHGVHRADEAVATAVAHDAGDAHAEEHGNEHGEEHDHADTAPQGSSPAGTGHGHGDAHAIPEFEAPAHEHAHGHQAVDVAAPLRDEVRIATPAVVAIVEPCAVPLRQPVRRSAVAHACNRALLARPGPDTGPPPSPRAPPVR